MDTYYIGGNPSRIIVFSSDPNIPPLALVWNKDIEQWEYIPHREIKKAGFDNTLRPATSQNIIKYLNNPVIIPG